jgi:hypothetical protein
MQTARYVLFYGHSEMRSYFAIQFLVKRIFAEEGTHSIECFAKGMSHFHLHGPAGKHA